MQKQSKEAVYQIPRYLGLRKIQEQDGDFQVCLGFADKNQIDLTLDREGI